MSVRLSPDGHGLRPPVGSLLAAKRAQPFRSKARKGVPVVSPSNSPILPQTRALFIARGICQGANVFEKVKREAAVQCRPARSERKNSAFFI